MNANESRELREQRAKIAHDMSELAAGGLKTAEDRTKFDALDSEQRQMKERIDRIEKASGVEEEMRTTGRPPAAQTQPADAEAAAKAEKEKRAKDYNAALRSYLLVGRDDMEPEQRKILRSVPFETRDMGTGGGNALQGSGGGYFVPVGFVHDVEQGLKYYGPMLAGAGSGVDGYPRIMPTDTGQPLPYPTSNDTGVTGELIGETQQVTTNDVTIGNIIFNAYKYSTKMVKVSLELLQDSAFDIEAFLKEQFAIRLGRILNTQFTIGTGTSQPNGIVTAAILGATAIGSSGNDGTSASTNTIGSDDLVALEHSVDILYRNGAKFMFHDTILRQIKQLKDKYGRPLWLPGLAVKEPDTINGYGYLINNDMDQLQSNAGSPPVTKKTALYGAINKYMIRRVRDLSVLRLNERFADQGQAAFIGFARYDGQLVDAGTNPVKYLKNVF